MILLIDTTAERAGETVLRDLLQFAQSNKDFEYVYAADMNISHCLGCNFCWLKTPGICVIQDDYAPLLKKMSKADQVWLISDTKFGFVTYKTKNIVDRVMPLVTMYLHMVGKQMRHVPRYDKNPDWGLIYTGEGDQEYLSQWCERVALNFGSSSRGAHRLNRIDEVAACM